MPGEYEGACCTDAAWCMLQEDPSSRKCLRLQEIDRAREHFSMSLAFWAYQNLTPL